MPAENINNLMAAMNINWINICIVLSYTQRHNKVLEDKDVDV